MTTWVEVTERENTITIDGYTSNKTERGIIKDVARVVAKYDKDEANALLECLKMGLDEYNNPFVKASESEGGYFFEYEEMSATRYNEETNEVEYKDGFHNYFCIRIVKKQEEQEEQEQEIETMENTYVTYEEPLNGRSRYDDYAYGESLGKTDKFFRHSIAYKYEDQLYETVLKDIEWNTSKTGLINPVAIFEPIDLDGAITTRATLHNISYIKKLSLGIGDRIRVYRSNKVIPKVHDSIDKSNNFTIPEKCPICGGETKIVKENDSEVLICMNDDCQGKLLGKLVHAVSRNALDIDGLSEATLEKFISLGWLDSIKSIYHLSDYKGKMYSLEGFGKKSVDKLLESIEKSRETTLDRFVYSLSIPMIGKSASKDIAEFFEYDLIKFFEKTYSVNCLGNIAYKNYKKYCRNHYEEILDLSSEFNFKTQDKSLTNKTNILQDKTFVITGLLEKYSNRDELKSVIESNGGKVSGSVSARTFALINNDIESSSSKNKKAKSLGIQIINEEQFMQLLN